MLAKMKGLREFLGEREEQGDPGLEDKEEEEEILTDELSNFTDEEESEEVVRLGLATSQESTKTTERIFDDESNSDEDEKVRRELLEISDNTIATGQKADESLLELRDFEIMRKSDEVAYEQEAILAMEREGKVRPEEIAKLWNNLARKVMDGIREVEELSRLEKELGIEESEDEENGEEELEVISSEEEEPEVEEVSSGSKEEMARPVETQKRGGELQWGQWLKKAR